MQSLATVSTPSGALDAATSEKKKSYRRISIEEVSFTPEQIEAAKLFNVFVVSLPRSGSSMMTGIIDALGVKIIRTSDTEEEVKKREVEEKRRYGGGYQMNPDGFYEITQDFLPHYIEVVSTSFGGCKLIIPLGRFQRDLVKFNPCARVIQMWRDPEEIRQSQQASYKGDVLPTNSEEERAKIRTRLAQSASWLKQQGIEALHVQYRDVVSDPAKAVREVAEFLGVRDEGKILSAIATVKPSRTRFKAEKLDRNI